MAPLEDDDDGLAISMQQTEGPKDQNFRVTEFKKALFET